MRDGRQERREGLSEWEDKGFEADADRGAFFEPAPSTLFTGKGAGGA
jgi:hypothetical protein